MPFLDDPPWIHGAEVNHLPQSTIEKQFNDVVVFMYDDLFNVVVFIDSFVSITWESNLTTPDKLVVEMEYDPQTWIDLRTATNCDISVTKKKAFVVVSKSADIEQNRIRIEARSVDALFELRRPWPYWKPNNETDYTNDYLLLAQGMAGNGALDLNSDYPIDNKGLAAPHWKYRVLQNSEGNGKIYVNLQLSEPVAKKMSAVIKGYPDKSVTMRSVLSEIQNTWNIRFDTERRENDPNWLIRATLPVWHDQAVVKEGGSATVQFSESMGTFRTTRVETLPTNEIGASYFSWTGWLSDPNVSAVIDAGGELNAANVNATLWGSTEFQFEGDMVYHSDRYASTMIWNNQAIGYKDTIYWLYNKDYCNQKNSPDHNYASLVKNQFWNGSPPSLGYKAENHFEAQLPENPVQRVNVWDAHNPNKNEAWEYRKFDRRQLWDWQRQNSTAQLRIMQQAEAARAVAVSNLIEGEVLVGTGYDYLYDYEVGSIVSLESPLIPFTGAVEKKVLPDGTETIVILARVESVAVTWDSGGCKITPRLNPDFPRVATDGNIPMA